MIKFTENQKETYSLAYIKQQFAKCDKLDTSYLKTGDKEPSWDGDLYLHKTNKLKAEDAIRIPVQIKGTEKFETQKMKFRVEKHHLDNYKRDNGVFFMVVQVNSDTNLDLYYCDLLSPDLDQLLAKNKGKYAYLRLKQFDTSRADKIEHILLNFANARKNLCAEDKYVEDLNLFDEIVVKFESPRNNLREILFDETVMYGKLNNLPHKLYPITKGMIDILETTIDANIIVNDIIYYSSFLRTQLIDKTIIRVGNSLTITSNIHSDDYRLNGKLDLKINLKMNRNFHSLYEDALFIEALFNSKGFYIDKTLIQISSDFEKYKTILDKILMLKEIKQLYNILRINKEFDFNKMKDHDILLLENLVEYFVHKNYNSFSFDQNGIWTPTISDYTFKFIVYKCDTPSGPEILNFFSDEIPLYCKYSFEENIEEEHSFYFNLNSVDFIELCNIDYSRLKNEIFKSENISISFVTLMTNFSLEVLKAFDISNLSEHKDLYESIIDYLKNIPILTELDNDIIFINECQFKKRLNTLDSLDHKKLLRLEIKYESLNENLKKNEMMFSINVLIENFEEATKYFNMLDDKIKDGYRNYPIFKLYKEPSNVI